MSSEAGSTSRVGAARPRAILSRPASRPLRKTATASAAEEGARPLPILIAARPALYREILARQLSNEPDFRITGQTRDEQGILAILAKERPRVLLLDYEGLGPNVEVLI